MDRNVVILFYFRTYEDEAGVMNFAGVLSGQLAGLVVPVETLGGGTRTYATFVRPAAFEGALPGLEAAKAWAEAELGVPVLRAEALDLMLPARSTPVSPAAGKSVRDCALAFVAPASAVQARVLVVDVPPPKAHLV